MKIPKQKHIRYNYTTEGDSVLWFFLIINTKREIDIYTKRIYEHFSNYEPIEEHEETDKKICGEEISYKLIRLKTRIGKIENWHQIYQGKVKRDERLYDRQQRDGLENFIDNQLS